MRFTLLFLLVISTPLLAQTRLPIPTAPNQRNAEGQRVGPWVLTYSQSWRETALPDSVAYYRLITFDKLGKPIGTIKGYYRTGELEYEGQALQIEPAFIHDGSCTWFYLSGKRSQTIVYHQGKKQDTVRSWYPNGNIKYTVPYVDGRRQGVATFWNEKGEAQKELYDKGQYIDLDSIDIAVADLAKKGQYEKALALTKKQAQFRIQTVGNQHPYYARNLNNTATVLNKIGRYDEAISIYQELLTLREKTVGKDHTDYAFTLTGLGSTHTSLGKYDLALTIYKQALSIQEKIDKSNERYATILNNLALLYSKMGQHDKALPLFQSLLTLKESLHGTSGPEYALAVNNLALEYGITGQYEKALPLFQKAVDLFEQSFGKEHPSYATSLRNLGGIYRRREEYKKALPLFKQALAIEEKTVGKNHHDYAFSLTVIAELYDALTEYNKADSAYQEALSVFEKLAGKNHPNYADCLSHLGILYTNTKSYAKALSYLQQALTIKEQVLGKDHPDYAADLYNLSDVYEQLGVYEKTIPLLIEARQQYKKQLLTTVGVLNESAIRSFQEVEDHASWVYSFGYSSQASALQGQHYNDALLNRGVGLLATQQLNRILAQTTDTVATRLANQLRQSKQAVNQQLNKPRTQQRGLDSLQQRAEAIEQQLISRLPEYNQAFNALRVEWQQVQQALKPDEAAIEFIAFDYYHKRWTDSTFYVALVLRPGWATPRMIPLTEARQLDTLLATNGGERRAAYVERLYTAPNRGVVADSKGKPRSSLYNLVWQPIDSLLTGVKRVYYAPAGLLHRINLSALPLTARQRVGEKYQLTLLASTRQLALSAPTRPTGKRALLMGNIQYERDSLAYRKLNARYQTLSADQPHIASRGTGSRGGSWDELENSGPEINAVGTLLTSNGYRADTLSGLSASEEAFYHFVDLPDGSPRYLHLATHGYFYETPTTQGTKPGDQPQPLFAQSTEALVRSGLVLAGGNHVWQGKDVPTGEQDGILTAYEISLRDLRATELVVLSACETGLGTVRGSEGVYGLQRAFKIAGVQNLIMSLWQVPDQATRRLMEAFYGYHLRNKLSIRDAFDKAVADLRGQYTEPYFWAGFVLME